MKTYPEKTVRARLKKFVDTFPTATAAAHAIGCTRQELSIAMSGGRVPSKALSAIKLRKVEVYTDEQ